MLPTPCVQKLSPSINVELVGGQEVFGRPAQIASGHGVFCPTPLMPKPHQNIVYLSAELNRLCRMRVSTYISIRDHLPVGSLILPLYSVVAHRNDTFRVQSTYFRTSVKDPLARFVMPSMT